ncbi:MAG: PH domain-containing protein [Oscillospiraceae bacterium]|nr:PH domain-containing protein [Oscillospiraceae bacterium]
MKLLDQLTPNEKVLWYGKKAKSVSFFESIFNALMPFALIWALFDGFVIYAISHANNADDVKSAGFGILGFFAIHLLPVWIYLAGILTSAIKAKHTEYCVTDKGVYVQSGVFSTNVIMRPFSDMNSVTVKQSLFDKIFKTGDVVMECQSVVYPAEKQMRVNGRPVRNPNGLCIENVSDYESVLRLVQERQAAAAAEAAAERNTGTAFRGQFTAQIAPTGSGMQGTDAVQQAQYAQQQAQAAQQQLRQSAFGQPVSQQPMFSDPQRGFSATSGSFVAGGIPQQSFNQPTSQQQSFVQPTPRPQSFMQPTAQPAPAPHFTVPQQPQGFEMPKGFEMPDLTVPEAPQQEFVDPTLAQAQSFRDPTLDYLDPNRPI